ncbi:hypothetical protein [Campylobacter devanensis]|uniref:hypothetical protein n=1 Tax=Campylobacter devanensis TaxID=3161138 RepID=UPI003014679C
MFLILFNKNYLIKSKYIKTSNALTPLYIPVTGSFHEHGSRFISSSFEFDIGWNYWFNWVITVAAGEAKDTKQKYSKSYKCNILKNFAILYICYFYHWYAFTFYRSKFAQK